MQRFERPQVERFLRAVDEALGTEQTIVVVGGAAVILGGGPDRLTTRDIDYAFGTDDHAALERAAEEARQRTGLAIPLDHAAVADGPYGLEERLVRVLPELERLQVQVPERHDLALMKAVRGAEADLAALVAVHRETPFEYDVLMARYEEEMGAVVGSPSTLRLNMLQLVEALFPERLGDAERRLARAHARWNEALRGRRPGWQGPRR